MNAEDAAYPQRDPALLRGVIPYLIISDAKAAAEFYAKAFGAREVGRQAIPDGRLIHCQMEINGGSLMFNDPFPEHGGGGGAPSGYMLHLQVDDAHVWWDRAVAAGCTVSVPLKQEFWGDYYGHLKDPFGVTWTIGSTPAKS